MLRLLALWSVALAAARAGCEGQDFAPHVDERSVRSLVALRDSYRAGRTDEAAAREHAASLFAGVTGAASGCAAPRFIGWYPGNEVGADARRGQPMFTHPRQFTERDRAANNVDNTIYVSAHFNLVARRHMESLTRATLDNAKALGLREIAPFPFGSVAVKAIWRVVGARGLRLGLWDQHQADAQVATGGDGFRRLLESEWRESVTVRRQPASPRSVVNAPIVPGGSIDLGYFYAVKVTPEIQRMVRTTSGPLPKLDDYLILVGVHIASKEMPDWVWTTFWFSRVREPLLGRIPAPWSNFNFNVTLSMGFPKERGFFRFKKIYNPYLEASQINGLISNCMTCHVGATYPAVPNNILDSGDSVPFDDLESTVRTDYVFHARTPRR